MTSGITDTLVFPFAEAERTVQHFFLVSAEEPGGLVVACRDHAVRMVNADLRPGIDAVLSLPKFNQPGFSLIVEVDGEGVENHLEAGRQIVVKPGIACLFLRCVYRGRKESTVAIEIVTEGVNQLVYKGTFGAAVHGIDLADDLFAAALQEDTAQKSNKQ